MPIYQMMLDLAQQKQQIQSGEMLNALRGVEIAQTIRQNKIEDDTTNRIRQMELAKLAQSKKSQDPMQDVPPEMRTLLQEQQQTQQALDSYDQSASAARLSGNLQAAKYFDDEASKARTNLTAIQGRVLAFHKEQNQHIGSIANDYDNAPTATIQDMNRMEPNWWLKPGAEKVELDAMGRPVPGDGTRAYMANKARQAMTVDQQLKLEEAKQRRIDNENNARDRKQLADDAAADRKERDRRAQAAQETKDEATRALTKEREARTELIKKKEMAAKDPSTRDFGIVAGKLQKDFKLGIEDAKVMARDVLIETAEIMRADPTKSAREAQDEAIDHLATSIAPGQVTETMWGMGKDKVSPPRYRPMTVDPNKPDKSQALPPEKGVSRSGKITEAGAPPPSFQAASDKVTAKGIGLRWMGGKLTVTVEGAKGANAQLAREAQEAIDKKADPEAVLKRLLEKVI